MRGPSDGRRTDPAQRRNAAWESLSPGLVTTGSSLGTERGPGTPLAWTGDDRIEPRGGWEMASGLQTRLARAGEERSRLGNGQRPPDAPCPGGRGTVTAGEWLLRCAPPGSSRCTFGGSTSSVACPSPSASVAPTGPQALRGPPTRAMGRPACLEPEVEGVLTRFMQRKWAVGAQRNKWPAARRRALPGRARDGHGWGMASGLQTRLARAGDEPIESGDVGFGQGGCRQRLVFRWPGPRSE